MSDLQLIRPDWPSPAGVRAAFTCRQGGVSPAPFDTLNMGSAVGDAPERVAENHRRVCERLGITTAPMWLKQVHGIAVHDPDAHAATHAAATAVAHATAHPAGQRADKDDPIADAAIARRPGHVCAVRVADCMPVLFAAADGSAVAAAHAGWRGLAAGVLEATVRGLGIDGPDLLAWLGPAIGADHFEVGQDVFDAFVAGDAVAECAFRLNSRGRWQCDLYSLARRRLARLGVRSVFGGGWCTYAQPDRFFSFRRDGQCGRMAAFVWLEA